MELILELSWMFREYAKGSMVEAIALKTVMTIIIIM